MIAFDFEYYRPETTEEAVSIYQKLQSRNKQTFYYSGGTEFISRARANEITADAIIDLKGIPECNEMKDDQTEIIIGSAATLTAITEASFFPLLSNVSRLIATRTERNKITIGGNITSHLFYREALLPFLLADSKVVIAGAEGMRTESVNEIFKKGVQLNEEEFVVQIITDSKLSQYPHANMKKTKHSSINYPIVSLATLIVDDSIRLAFSGVCTFPFRMKEIEMEINEKSASVATRVDNAMKLLPETIIDDMHATAAYRKFVLEHSLTEMLEKMEGVS